MNLARRFWALSALALTLVLGACSTAPQNTDATTLEPQFGTDQKDIGTNIVVTSTGDVVVLSTQTGTSYSPSYGVDAPFSKVVWSKFDTNGNKVWDTDVQGDNCAYEYAYGYACNLSTYSPKALIAGTSGSTYAAVATEQYDDYSGYYYTDYTVTKYTAYGSSASSRYFGEASSYAAKSGGFNLAVDSSGAYYVVKVQSSSPSAAKTNVVAKYSSSGSLVWQRYTTVGIPYSVAVAGNGNVFVAGKTGLSRLSNSGTVNWTKAFSWKFPEIALKVVTSGNYLYVLNSNTVRKLDANGKVLWTKVQSGLNGINVRDLSVDKNGNVFIAGKYSYSSSDRDPFVRKLSASGATVWTRTILSSGSFDGANGVHTVTGTNIYVTGEVQSFLPGGGSYQGGESDAFIRKYGGTGVEGWTR